MSENSEIQPEEVPTKEDLVLSNQTSFGSSQPLMESVSSYDEPITANTQKGGKMKLVRLMAAVLGILLLAVIAFAYMATQKTRPSETVEPQVTPTPAIESDPIKKRILSVEKLLDSADPTRQEDPFPPVGMDIILDKLKK